MSSTVRVMTRASNKGLVIWLAIVAGMSNLAGASIMFDILGEKWSGLFLAIVGSLNAATAAFVAGGHPAISEPTAAEIGSG